MSDTRDPVRLREGADPLARRLLGVVTSRPTPVEPPVDAEAVVWAGLERVLASPLTAAPDSDADLHPDVSPAPGGAPALPPSSVSGASASASATSALLGTKVGTVAAVLLTVAAGMGGFGVGTWSRTTSSPTTPMVPLTGGVFSPTGSANEPPRDPARQPVARDPSLQANSQASVQPGPHPAKQVPDDQARPASPNVPARPDAAPRASSARNIGPQADSHLAEETQVVLSARQALRSGEPTKALSLLQDYERTHRTGALAEERAFLRLRSHHALRAGDIAQRCDVFLRAFPDSSYAVQVRAMRRAAE